MHTITDNALSPDVGGVASGEDRRVRPLFGAHGVRRIQTVFVNCYMVASTEGRWVMVDAGLPGFHALILRHVQRYHGGAAPEAIILTHGHFDHVGNALELAREWKVPIYCHRLELPYLTGRSDYPPQDPTIGGAIAMLSRAFPHSGHDFSERIAVLPEDGTVPGLPDWRWLHTPGHTPGHVSLFRHRDRALIAGDAVVTMNLDSWTTQLTHRRELSRPPAPLTPDWESARRSISDLAELEPLLLFTGHGAPLYGSRLSEEMSRLVKQLQVPARGRYGREPALADETGLMSVPPPVHDPLPKRLLGMAALGLGAFAYKKLRQRRILRV
jgi:glyoxylase-like metal-dependent hydrolase (beta-lactamase superfamily II)